MDRKLLDTAQHVIASDANESPTEVLVVADENTDPASLNRLSNGAHLTVITNRYDIYSACKKQTIETSFSDFNFRTLNKKFDVIIYQVSKERPVCHKVFNSITACLTPEGTFLLGGKKQHGIKSHHKQLINKLGFEGTLTKQGDSYTADLQLARPPKEQESLDDKSYDTLRPLPKASFTMMTKPGVYGWNKIDKGSEILAEETIRFLAQEEKGKTYSVLDLGCGYGFLSVTLLERIPEKIREITATDNCAAAVYCAHANLETRTKEITSKVIADDCAININEDFELIICNPPFHQGFDTSSMLTHKFLKNSADRLHPSGLAFFVVNAFIPLEKLGKQYFGESQVIKETPQFKVIRFSH